MPMHFACSNRYFRAEKYIMMSKDIKNPQIH